MPHANRRHKRQPQLSIPRNKRGEVESDDGWTRIVRSNRILQSDAAKSKEETDSDPPVQSSLRNEHHQHPRPTHDDPEKDRCTTQPITIISIAPRPTELPDGSTLEKALSHYHRCANAWRQSQTWASLTSTLTTIATTTTHPEPNLNIRNCICLGLGSPTGLILPGPIDRRTVSMYQLAAFVSLISILNPKQTPTPIAQDPRFNPLDAALLAHLNIQVVSHPTAFNDLSPTSFAFCPGPERSVLEATLASNPALYLGSGALDHSSSSTCAPPPTATVASSSPEDIIHHFKRDKKCMRLPDFEAHDYAFYDMHLFWPSTVHQAGPE